MKHLSVEIESDLGNVSLVAIAMNAVCRYGGLKAVVADEVELCLVEAITNCIRHAYHGQLAHIVRIEVGVDVNYLQFEVCDRGTQMGAEHVERLIKEENAAESESVERALLPEGGRGLQIIRRVMDDVTYSREDNWNRLTMTKRITSS